MQYTDDDKKTMLSSHLSFDKSRVNELLKYIKNSNYKKIGIANCKSVQKYADALAKYLTENGVEVFAINCKESGLKNDEVLGAEYRGLSCDPLSQATYLNNNNTELNINVGLCLGHGIIFSKYSNAPTTTILVKDFSSTHNNAIDCLL